MNDQWDQLIRAAAEAPAERPSASSRLKSRLLSRLIELEQSEGPLRVLSENKNLGDPLCVFEHIVAALPSDALQSRNPCSVCHARLLGEQVENAPIYWPGCPYANFCGH